MNFEILKRYRNLYCCAFAGKGKDDAAKSTAELQMLCFKQRTNGERFGLNAITPMVFQKNRRISYRFSSLMLQIHLLNIRFFKYCVLRICQKPPVTVGINNNDCSNRNEIVYFITMDHNFRNLKSKENAMKSRNSFLFNDN